MSTKIEIAKIIYEADYLLEKQKLELIKNIREVLLPSRIKWLQKEISRFRKILKEPGIDEAPSVKADAIRFIQTYKNILRTKK